MMEMMLMVLGNKVYDAKELHVCSRFRVLGANTAPTKFQNSKH